jgi:hypothetical protein
VFTFKIHTIFTTFTQFQCHDFVGSDCRGLMWYDTQNPENHALIYRRRENVVTRQFSVSRLRWPLVSVYRLCLHIKKLVAVKQSWLLSNSIPFNEI